MAGLWAWQRRAPNVGIVHVGWVATVAGLAVLYANLGAGNFARRSAIAWMMGSWGARLAVHLLYTRASGSSEGLPHTRFGTSARFFWFFQAQGLAAVFFSLPALLAAANPAPQLSIVEEAAAGLWIVAFAGESTADRQLLRFKTDPATAGHTCRTGLWRYSRHPNYFFEWLMWVAFALFAAGSPDWPWGWSAFACPAAMLYLLLRVTGIPANEDRALRSRGDEYRQYQQTTSAFVPWIPSRPRLG